MLPKNILIALATFTVANGFTIHADLPDGDYMAKLNPETGLEEFVLLPPLTEAELANIPSPSPPNTTTTTTTTPSHPHVNTNTRRGVSWPGSTYPDCSSQNHATFRESDLYNGGSWDSFYNRCASLNGAWRYERQALFTRHGTSVSYMCNYSSKGNPCRIEEWVDAVDWIQASCNFVQGGWRRAGELLLPYLLLSPPFIHFNLESFFFLCVRHYK